MSNHTKKTVCKRGLIKIILLLAVTSFSGLLSASTSVTDITTSTTPATPLTYAGTDANTYNWGLGNDTHIDGFTAGGISYVPAFLADNVVLRREDNANAAGFPCGIFAEKSSNFNLVTTYPEDSVGNGNCDMEAMISGNIISRGGLDVFDNVGFNAAKNIERVDFIFTGGITAPANAPDLAESGHIVTEKSGNNPLQIAVILSLDGSGNPASYGPLLTVDQSSNSPDVAYGIYNSVPRTAFDFLTNTTQSEPRGFPTRTGGSNEFLGAAFVTLDDLGIAAGQKYFGFSYFPADVDTALGHVLADPSTFPDDTGGNNGDADMYGGTAGYFTLASLVPPEVTITGPLPTATPANQAAYPVSGTCSIGDGDVTVSIAGATPASQPATCTAGGAWGPVNFDVTAIADGIGVIVVDASQTDAASNVGNAPQLKANKNDGIVPTVAIQNAPASVNDLTPYTVTFEFSEDVTGFVLGDITVGNGAASNFVAVDGNTYTADITPTGAGDITIDVAAAVAQDVGGNDNTAATQATTTFDTTVPTVDIQNEPAVVNDTTPYSVTFEFSEDVTGFVLGDITVGNGAASNFVAVDGNTYTADITPDGNGDITIDVAAGVAQDVAANDNTAAVQAVTTFDNIAPVVVTTSAPAANAANQAAYPVSGTCTAGDGNVTVGIVGATPASQSVVCTAGGTWSAVFDVTAIADGPNVVDVTASQTDAGGNTGNAVLVEANKDASAPVVTTNPTPVATTANQAAYPVSGTCTAGDGNVTVGIVGATPASQSVVCTAGGTWGPVNFDVTVIADGPNVIDVTANQTDAGGNTGNAPLVEANKDATAPTVTTNAPPTATTANQAAYPVSGTCTAGDGNVTVGIVGATPASQSVVCTAGGTWSAVFDVTAIADGPNVVDVTASQTDAGGNTGSAPLVEADKDATAPTVVIQGAPASANDLSPYTVTFEFSKDVTGFDLSDITVANGVASNFVAVDGNTYTADITPDGNGDISIDVAAAAAQDTGGNDNTAAAQVVTVLATDDDNDGIPDSIECPTGPPFNATCVDSDGDGTPDFQDKDSDGDGIPDSVEAGIDPNNPIDTDNDGLPDYKDLDSDNDGIPDTFEGGASGVDTDGDGIDDAYDADADGDSNIDPGKVDANADGIADNAAPDTDNDGTPDFQDLDSDADGIPDAIEGGGSGIDIDGDGIDDAFDIDQTGGVDANGDGIDDAVTPTDTDSDGAPDYQDLDTDNDGIPDSLEADVSGVDTDGDGIDDLYDVDQTGGTDANGDGVDDAVSPTDTDNDTVPDYRDLDSDNDSIPDIQETGGLDANQDGLLDAGGTLATAPLQDTDTDGTPDFRDVDSNNDGTNDIVDAGNGGFDANNDGMVDLPSADTDGDGVPDVVDPDPTRFGVNSDADGDGIPNAIDLDDDNDGIPDTAEQDAGGNDVDTDGDGIVDRLDRDSDNDGLPDSIEAVIGTPVDLDADGVIDNFVDANNDGLHDTVDPALDPVDTDADGIDDFRDIDSDDDGLTDLFEASGGNVALDPNGDGRIDNLADTDLDGLADVVDPVAPGGTAGTILPNPDTDADGIPNFRDTDSDNDSIPDTIEAGTNPNNPTDTDGDGTPDFLDLDSDNDGADDATEAGADPNNPIDSDGDGTPDYQDTDPVAPADDEKLETAVTGAGSVGLTSLLVLLVLSFMRFGGFKVLKKVIPMASIAMLLFPAVAQADTNYCGRHNPLDSNDDNDFNECFYIGVGGLTTHVDPEGKAGGWSTSDDSDSGYTIIGGWHFKPHWFGEISYTDLGEAGLSNDNPAITNIETISYEIPSIHVGYLLREPENSFNAYGKIGVSFIDNEASSPSVPFEKQTDAQLTGGIGLQWRAQSSGLFARLAADFYDRDAASVGIVVGYGFGGGTTQAKVAKPEEDKFPRIEVIDHDPVVVPPPPKDSDADGVFDSIDQCPNSKPGIEVDEKGCAIKTCAASLTGVLEGVNFHSGSARLTADATGILGKIAQQMKTCPDFNVKIVGHTDSQGSAKLNEKLSLARAKSVAAYLQQQGVASSQMAYEGRGESDPRADNSTAEGRAMNRRVELLPR